MEDDKLRYQLRLIREAIIMLAQEIDKLNREPTTDKDSNLTEQISNHVYLYEKGW